MSTAAMVLFVAVVVGSLLQRVSGMGLGLIAGPVLSVALGPVEGILLINVLATVNAAITTLTVRKNVDWTIFASIAPFLVLGAIPGAILVRESPTDALLIIVGVLLLAALSVVTIGKRYVPTVRGAVPAAFSGAVGGFMNTLAGVAGPAITVYAQAARWPQRTYAATLQPIFMVGGAISFGIKELSGAADLSAIGVDLWLAGGAAMLVGIFLGVCAAPHIPSQLARNIALGLAIFGGLTALARGASGLLA